MNVQQIWVAPIALVTLFFPVVHAQADSIRLTNGDIIRGEVVSLGEQELTIRSENFGEMKVPRDKVELIAMAHRVNFRPHAVPANERIVSRCIAVLVETQHLTVGAVEPARLVAERRAGRAAGPRCRP